RSLLRVAIPRGIRDSTQIIRATLYLVPIAPAFGTVADSFFVRARRVGADLGAKSPIGTDTFGVNSIALGAGASDTVRLEVTSLLRLWQTDTTIAPAMYLQLFSLDRDSTTSPPSLVGFEGISFARM